MKKRLTVFCLAAAFSAPAQTLFHYGKESVSAATFLEAFQKNNQGPVTGKAIEEYLDLYIASRLKIQEAKEKRFDTLPQLVADLAALRSQILPSYLNDKESLNKMLNEAFSRSQKDLRIAHIFIAAGNDAAAAEAKRDKVLQALKKNDFSTVAKEYSDDPSAKVNGGDLGWITVFSLPYELENLAYGTPAGTVSAPYQSRAGYHLFKNIGSRKALGRVRAAQILLAIPPNSTEADKAVLKRRADSLYKRLLAGDDFGNLATAFSNDVIAAASKGQMPEFGVGTYDPAFENAILGLTKDGAISKPFQTAHGFHIVKRITIKPVPVKLTEEGKEDLRKRLEQSDRTRLLTAALAQKVLKQAGYQKLAFSDAELQAYTDSVLSYQVPRIKIDLQPTTSLLKVGDHAATVSEWIAFAQTGRFKADGSGAKPYPQLWEEFVQATALNYYQDHLEDFNEDFRRQVTEFAEGNLFFEVMQRQVWTPAQTDSAGLVAYFEQHKTAYQWKESADAVVFYATGEPVARELYAALRRKPANWKSVLANFAEQVTADSNRFELSQLPQGAKQRITEGLLTTPVYNKADNSTSFAYVLQLHNKPEPRSFTEAKGLVINDYQLQLEKAWVEELKKKYPVTVDEKVLSEVVRKAGGK